jgi:hypothetical protein
LKNLLAEKHKMFKDEADFKKLVDGLNIDNKPNPAHREKLRQEMLSVFNEFGQQQSQTLRRTMMKGPIPKLAAAVIIISVVIGVHYFTKPQVIDESVQPVIREGVQVAPIDIKLPRAMFVGTPQPTRVPNLEKPLGRPRDLFLAPVGTKNVAFGKPVSSSDEEPIIGEIKMITDGDKEATDGSYVELGPFLQHITIDLEAIQEIYAIVVWHYHKQARVYYDVVVQVADDPDFTKNVRTVFNNDIDNSAGLGVGQHKHYVETNEGKLIDAKGMRARYVRLYSKGNSSDDLNHYIEVEVYGKPVGQ